MIAEHLGLDFGPVTSRRVRPAVDQLTRAGLLMATRRCGVAVWDLTPGGRRHVQRAVAEGAVVLPDSPQLRVWAASRAYAEATVTERVEAVSEALTKLEVMLSAAPLPGSDEWFAVADLVRERLRHLGVTVHCLREWPAPSEDRADRDDLAAPGGSTVRDGSSAVRRRGRRSVLRLSG